MKSFAIFFLSLILTACAEKSMQGGPMTENPVGITGTMTLVNVTKMPISNVIINRCNDRSFSPRRNEEIIPANGGKYTFTLLPGCWILHVGNRAARQTFGVIAQQDLVVEYRGN